MRDMTGGIIGHQKILDYFDKVIAAGSLSHAYCFVGPSRVGRRAVAKMLSARLLNVKPDRLGSHADFIEINQGVDETTGRTKKDISIEQLRDCQCFFSEYSFLGGYKIIIIDPADRMSLAAANALLKTLEEPRQKTLLFLLAVDQNKLPQTIYSRCQMVYFSPVSNNEIAQALAERGAEKAGEIARLSCGLPGQAISLAENKDSYGSYQKEVSRFESLSGAPFYDKIKKVEDLFGDKKDHIAAREKLGEVLDIWSLLMRESLLGRSSRSGEFLAKSAPAINQPERSKKGLKIYDLIQVAKKNLEKNIHPRLLIEQILLSLP